MSRTVVATVVLVLAGAASAVAQPAHAKRNPTPQELDAARAHFREAEAAKARGDFKTAAVEYLAAYELFEEPEFFFDVADVYRLGGDDDSALTYYERYLELDPQGRGAPAARTAVDRLRHSIAAKQDAARKAASDAELEPTNDGQHPAPDAHVATTPSPAVPAADSADAGRGLRIAGIASAGAGVIALGAGIAFGLRARAISNEVSGWTTFQSDRYDQGKAAERDMIVLTGVGAAALFAGGMLYYLGDRASQQDTAVVIVPAIDASSIALTAAGRF